MTLNFTHSVQKKTNRYSLAHQKVKSTGISKNSICYVCVRKSEIFRTSSTMDQSTKYNVIIFTMIYIKLIFLVFIFFIDFKYRPPGQINQTYLKYRIHNRVIYSIDKST